jgi:transposase-like protein
VDRSALELLLGQGVSVERIAKRFGKDPSTVSYWMRKHGLDAPDREKHAAKGGIERERLEGLVNARMSIAQIAETVGLSKTTVRHWLRRYDLRTQPSERIAKVRAARQAGRLTVTLSCPVHGDTEFAIEGRGYYRCKRCRAEGVTRRRRMLKELLVADAGGGCAICGYDGCVGALHFHHLDPAQKRLEISRNGITLSLETLRLEAAKCVLLCSNCHAEVEAGLAEVPATVAVRARHQHTKNQRINTP